MLAPRFRFASKHLFYEAALVAVSLALFSSSDAIWFGFAIATFATLVWWQILVGAKRELLHGPPQVLMASEKTLRITAPPQSKFQFFVGLATPAEWLGGLAVLGITAGLMLPATEQTSLQQSKSGNALTQATQNCERVQQSWLPSLASTEVTATHIRFPILSRNSANSENPNSSVIHFVGIVHLLAFVVVVVYPVRWLHQLRSRYGGGFNPQRQQGAA